MLWADWAIEAPWFLEDRACVRVDGKTGLLEGHWDHTLCLA